KSGTIIAATENDTIRTWDVVTGQAISEHRVINPGPIAFLGDTSMLLFSGYERALSSFDVFRPTLVAPIGSVFRGPALSVSSDSQVFKVGVSYPNGSYFFVLRDGEWDELFKHPASMQRSAPSDRRSRMVDLLRRLNSTDRPAAALSPDGSRVAEVRGSVLRLW